MHVRCPCGDWEWREITIALALTALERYCPRCRSRVLLIFRRQDPIAAVPLSEEEGGVERAIRGAGLAPEEVRSLVRAFAGEMAS